MRLYEIIGHERTEIETMAHSGSQINNLDPETYLGGGSKAVVHQDEDDPHMVKRYSRNPGFPRFDRFNRYAEIIVERKLWENPHFPRIYETETEIASSEEDGGTYINWKVEKLFSYETLNLDDAKAMVYNYFNEKFFRVAMNMVPSQLSPDNIDEVYFNHRVTLANETNRPVIAFIVNDMCDQILPMDTATINKNNETFGQAVHILNELQDAIPEFGNDLMAINVMFRRGPGGVQMVFTDPF